MTVGGVAVELQKCAREGCENLFEPKVCGGSQKSYCSVKCRLRHYHEVNREKMREQRRECNRRWRGRDREKRRHQWEANRENLLELKCERQGCENLFRPKPKGGTKKRFCCHACARKASNQNFYKANRAKLNKRSRIWAAANPDDTRKHSRECYRRRRRADPEGNRDNNRRYYQKTQSLIYQMKLLTFQGEVSKREQQEHAINAGQQPEGDEPRADAE